MTGSPLDLTSEEDLKIKVVIPLLEQLGWDPGDLVFEKSFSMTLGTCAYRIDSAEQQQRASGRLDILLMRNGVPLAVIEVKSKTEKLDEAAVKQAASYACLLDYVPPIAILTNGLLTKYVDPIKKTEIPPEELTFEEGYRPSIDAELRTEALRAFVGYSQENLVLFCQAQASSSMDRLVGGPDDPGKKYIPELYEPPPEMLDAVDKFLKSKSALLPVIGPSGVGKSCLLCHVTRTLLDQGVPTLFYNASDFRKGGLERIGSDLNWALSPQHSVEGAIKRFLEVFRGKPVCLVIDALDSLDRQVAAGEIEDLLARLSQRNVKVIASLKPDLLPNVSQRDGLPTHFANLAYHHNRRIGLEVPELDHETMSRVVGRYRSFFGVHGPIEPQVLTDGARNPFFLRLCFELARSAGSDSISYLSGSHLFSRYLDEQLAQFASPEVAQATVTETARLMMERDSGSITVRDLRSALRLSPTEAIDEELFRRSILQRSSPLLEGEIQFYFDRLRDFLIAFRVLRLQTLPADDLRIGLSRLTSENVQTSVRDTFYLLADPEVRRRLDGPVFANLAAFAGDYDELLSTHFPAFRNRFPPYTNGTIGVGAYVDLRRIGAPFVGFRRLEPGEERVLVYPAPATSWLSWGRNGPEPLQVFGTQSLHHFPAYNNFRQSVPRATILESEVFERLKEIVRDGFIDESQSPILLSERILAVAARHLRDEVRVLAQPRVFRLPLALSEIVHGIVLRNARRGLHDDFQRNQVATGRVKPVSLGTGLHVIQFTNTKEDSARIEAEAQRVAAVLTSPRYPMDDVERCLWGDVTAFAALGNTDIRTTFVRPHDNMDKATDDPSSYWTPETKRSATSQIYAALLGEYGPLILRNFPTLAEEFQFRRKLPLRGVIHICDDPYRESFSMVWLKSPTATSEVCIDEEPIVWPGSSGSVVVGGMEHEIAGGLISAVERILEPRDSFTPVDADGGLCPVRSLVYGQLIDDLNGAISAFQRVLRDHEV